MTLDSFQFQLCDIQGRLFELSVKKRYDSDSFIQTFLTSRCAAALDDIYDRLQWAGEEYILEELNDEVKGLAQSQNQFSTEVMYWAGYLYRYWHFYTGHSSKDIYRIADSKTMNESWLGFHTLDNEMAIDNLIEIYDQKKSAKY